jgi:hypothetical protein
MQSYSSQIAKRLSSKLFNTTVRQHFLHTTASKEFKLTESVYLQKKTNNSTSIDSREAYQQFIFTEAPYEAAQDHQLKECFD